MESILDSQVHYCWFPEKAVLKDRELWIVLVEAKIAERSENVELLPGCVIQGAHQIAPAIDSRRVIVYFGDTICFHVFDEFSRLESYKDEEREKGVIALHKNSALTAWLKESTVLHHTLAGEFLHYSVLTANECYHIITRGEPSIYEEQNSDIN